MTSGTVSRTILDDTLPGGPVQRTYRLCGAVEQV
jgi:hypothetical protein